MKLGLKKRNNFSQLPKMFIMRFRWVRHQNGFSAYRMLAQKEDNQRHVKVYCHLHWNLNKDFDVREKCFPTQARESYRAQPSQDLEGFRCPKKYVFQVNDPG